MPNKEAVLFDMDGVLVLTESLKAEAHAAATQYFGGQVSPAFYATVMGQVVEVIRSAFLAAGEVTADPQQYIEIYEQTYQHLLQTKLEITPGAVELLMQLKQRGYRLGLITSDHSPTMREILTRTHLLRFFDTIISRDDVTRSKPAPDAYLLALKRLAIPASAALVIEDSEAGVQAAVSAGLRTLALRHSFNLRHDFSCAFQVIDSFCDPLLMIKMIEQTRC
jgi:HAD superfamily hydrolase (TIGR01509 family)